MIVRTARAVTSEANIACFHAIIALVIGCSGEPSQEPSSPHSTPTPTLADTPSQGTTTATQTAVIAPSCFDGQMNGSEEGVDCGGHCDECSSNPNTVDPSVPTDIGSVVDWLYSGDDPPQEGVDPAEIDSERVSVILGRVLDQDGSPIAGVEISALGHSELGYTHSREDGWFDFVVNGGGAITVQYRLGGYIESQRKVRTRWRDFIAAPDVRLQPFDSVASLISTSSEFEEARGSVQTDDNGSRQATLLFPPGLEGTMLSEGGEPSALPSIFTVRATEFTVGTGGPESMPGALPPTSGYTYAVEFSIDEAQEAGATNVEFSAPLPFYVENFLGFPVGEIVPAGYYDRQRGLWIPSENGRIIQIRRVDEAGLAVLTLKPIPAGEAYEPLEDDYDAVSDPEGLGLTEAELAKVAELYCNNDDPCRICDPGDADCESTPSLWRVPISHFTPWDCNWPYGPAGTAEAAVSCAGGTCDQPTLSCPSTADGSIIECENMVLGEQIAAAGMPTTLNYRSSRASGSAVSRTLEIPLVDETVPEDLLRIDVEIVVGNQVHRQRYDAPEPDLVHIFTWNGKVYDQPWIGDISANVRISMSYPAVYYGSQDLEQAFAEYPSGTQFESNRQSGEVTIVTEWQAPLRNWSSGSWPVAGWSLGFHHVFSPSEGVIYFGDGREQRAEAANSIISTIAGIPGELGYDGEGLPATESRLNQPNGLDVDAEGRIFIAESGGHRIRLMNTTGVLNTIVGTENSGDTTEGSPGTETSIKEPSDVVVDDRNEVYFSDRGNGEIKRLSAQGVVWNVGANGNTEYNSPTGVALDEWGNLYVDSDGGEIYRITQNGLGELISDGGSSREDVDGRGYVYYADPNDNVIEFIDTDGEITTVAGSGSSRHSGDGGFATAAGIGDPWDVMVTQEGEFYIADQANHVIRKVDLRGVISTVAGVPGNRGFSGDGGPARKALLNTPRGVDIDPAGSLYIADTGNHVIRKISPASFALTSLGEYLVSSADASEAYVFDAQGRHLKTVDGHSGATLLSFSYADDLLVAATDAFGQTTTIERDQDGNPTAIVGPMGHHINLSLDQYGFLSTVTGEDGATYSMTYKTAWREDLGEMAPTGLLETFTEPNESSSPSPAHHTFFYDDRGRLLEDEGANGAAQTLDHSLVGDRKDVVLTSQEERVTKYSVETLSDGSQQRTVTSPDGTLSTSIRADTAITSVSSDGTTMVVELAPDPRWGMSAPYTSRISTTLPISNETSELTILRESLPGDSADPVNFSALTETLTLNGELQTVSRYQREPGCDPALKGCGGELTITSPMGRTTQSAVDSVGRVVKSQVPGLYPSSMSYDPTYGRLASVSIAPPPGIDPTVAARTTSYSYHECSGGAGTCSATGRKGGMVGYLASVTDSYGYVSSFSYDASGRVVESILPGNRVVGYTYDLNGNLTSLAPPGQPAHEFTYDVANRPTGYYPPAPDGGQDDWHTEFEYTDDDQLLEVRYPDGDKIEYEYRFDGGLGTYGTQLTRADASHEDGLGRVTISWDYYGEYGSVDPSPGKLKAVHRSFSFSDGTRDNQAVSYAWDGGLQTSETWSGAVGGAEGITVSSERNSYFWITKQRVGSDSVALQYDSDGLATQIGNLRLVHDDQDSDPSVWNGSLREAHLSETISTYYQWTGFGELERIWSLGSDERPLYSASYQRDGLGRIAETEESIADALPNHTEYLYDSSGRLSEVWRNEELVERYTYDLNGNRTAATTLTAGLDSELQTLGPDDMVHDYQDRLVRYGDLSFSYTKNGEMSSKTAANGSATRFQYDAFGVLVGVELLPEHGASDYVEYVVDGRDRRVGKLLNGAFVEGYLYGNQLNIIATVDEEHDLYYRFVYGTSPQTPDYVKRLRDGRLFRIICDHVGSVRLVVDASSGAIMQHLEYDAYGRVLLDEVADGFRPIPMGFAGGLYDRSTGLVRFGARDYDPEVGRWTTKDPVGFRGGSTNLYIYAANSPTQFIDPTGLWEWGDPAPQWLVDSAAGIGDTISFGLTDLFRDAVGTNIYVDQCSFSYSAGEAGGVAFWTVAGGAGGWRAAGTKGPGKEFSHWIPNRSGGPRSKWNGNFVDTKVHALSDPYRYRFMPSAWKDKNPIPSRVVQQWVRIPTVYKGAAAGGAAASIRPVLRRQNESD